MKTTLKEIESYKPNHTTFPWKKLLNYLDKTTADNKLLDFIIIREAIGIKGAIWCLRTQKYRNYCLFLADIAELVLPVFETTYPDIKEPRQAINAIRDWHSGNITTEQLNIYAKATGDVAMNTGATSAATAYAAAYTDIATTAAYSIYAATNAAANATRTATSAANCNMCAAATIYYALATNHKTIKSNWKEIDKLFCKHFSDFIVHGIAYN